MKRVVVMAAVLGLVAGSAISEDVTSVNAVGFVNIPVGTGQYAMMGVQFDDLNTANPTVVDVLGLDVPEGTQAYLYNGSAYIPEAFSAGAWTPGTNVIDRGTAIWVYTPTAHDFSGSGQVPDQATDILIAQGYQMIAYPYPAARLLSATEIGQNASEGDQLYIWNGTGYTPYNFASGSWSADPVLAPGVGMWYYQVVSGVSTNSEPVPYTL